MTQTDDCEHSSYKLCFKLKQHTPIIHFQAKQDGATLRASELKPKLDKFILTEIGNGNYEEGKRIVNKQWLVGNGEHPALDYKVKILLKSQNKVNDDDLNNPLYFAGRKPYNLTLTEEEEFENNRRKFLYSDMPLQIFFTVWSAELRQKIEMFFALFLSVTNFGTRQNKGFGSFYIIENTYGYIAPRDALSTLKKTYLYAHYSNENYKNIMKYIEVIYALMKTGINFPDYQQKKDEDGNLVFNSRGKKVLDKSKRGDNASYYKSFLFSYMLDKIPKIGNEKRFIKENFFDNHKISNDGIEKKYVRALLGVGEHVEFKDKRNGTVTYNSDNVARFKSPVTFKIIEDELFIIAENIEEGLFGQYFVFSHNGHSEKISTPDKKIFCLKDFLISYGEYFNNLNPDYKNNPFDKKIKKAKMKKLQGVKNEQ